MAWKLRKDKIGEEPPDAEAIEASGNGSAPPGPVLQAEAPRPESTFSEEAEGEAADDSPVFDFSGSAFRSEAPVQEDEPIALGGPLGGESVLEAEPPTAAQEPEVEAPDYVRTDAQAAAFVTTDEEQAVPKVAPYIVDLPPPDENATVEALHTLVVRIGSFAANFSIERDVITIGRPDTQTQTYPDIELELDDAVSRRHAEVRRQGDQYFLVDLGSTNGTLLNGERLAPHQEIPLAHGDRIHIGERTEIVFE